MGEVINLNKIRKAREKEERDRLAAEKRARFGHSKLDKSLQESEREKRERELDSQRFDDDGPEPA